ncbi:MAG: phosphate ABC transporter permease subunit PstC, partial [Acetobacteraceae bacterium]|nr:phosphate ABC transporter permease subunit PstC [Acetobacteraceae bacterium]
MSLERLAPGVLRLVAFSALTILALITLFVAIEGMEAFARAGPLHLLLGSRWAPTQGDFGLLSMVVGSLLVTAGALAVGVPLGVGCATFLSELARPSLARSVKPVLELLAAIPSVVYGFIGLVILVPLVRQLGGPGFSVLTASIVLALMILPTVASISYDAIRAVPWAYREASLALGVTRWRTTRMVVWPACRSGLLTAVVLGMGRAIGETMAVIMVAGNSIAIPRSILDPVRTLTSNIALEMGYATGLHRRALFASGLVLFVIILCLN